MFAAKSKYALLTGVVLAGLLAFFWLVDWSYTIYGVSVDCEPLPAQTPLVPEYQTDRDHGAVVLMYHHIVPDDELSGDNIGNNAIISYSQFAEEMQYLADNGYHTFTMSEVAGIIENKLPFPEKTVIITFDDGYASNYTLAYPLLRDYGLKATIAVVVVSSLNASEPGGAALQNIPHLTFAEMREMDASGLVEIGSHSYDGHGLIRINQGGKQGKFFVDKAWLPYESRMEEQNEYVDRIRQDLRFSKLVLEAELGHKVNYFAYPYGVYNSAVSQALADGGFLIAVTTTKGTIDNGSDIFKLNRRNVDQGIGLDEYAKLLKVD